MKLVRLFGRGKGRLSVATLAILAVVIATFMVNTASAQDKTVLTFHDGQTKKSFVTDASTVGEALARAEVVIGENDLVEPSLDQKVVGDSFSVNIYRSHLVTVVDGGSRYNIATAYRSPEAIAQAAGLTVYPEDEFEFIRADDFLSGDVGLTLVIDRAFEIELVLYGSVANVRTQAEDVASFLDGKGIVLGTSEVLQPGIDTAITDGMRVSVAKIGTEVVVNKELVAYGREVINDPNSPIGSEIVKTPGVDGESMVTYEVTLRDGAEIGRVKLQEVVIIEPKDEVVIVGSQAFNITGDKLDWMRLAGITQSDWTYVDSIITKESQWRYQVWNTLGSGAYGLCQALPATKMATAGDDYMTNPVTQLKWCDDYAQVRYGSWAGAYGFWQINHWW